MGWLGKFPVSNASEDSSGLTPRQDEIFDRIAGRVVELGMTVPAILFLESSKPLSFIGSQLLLFMDPFVRIFLNSGDYAEFAEAIGNRDKFELFIQKIEKLQGEFDRRKDEGS
jgi:hypothetical protein